MRLLITGGAGYIGSHVVKEVLRVGHEVAVIDTLYSGQRDSVPPSVDFYHGSCGDKDLLQKVFSKQKFDAVIHLAAFTEVEESVRNPAKYYENNVVFTLNLANACILAGVKDFLFSSTAAVYGRFDAGLVSEGAALAPISPYGHSKLMAEQILSDFQRAGQLRFRALRYFNVAGADPDLTIGQSTPNVTHLVKVAAQVAVGIRPEMHIYGDDYPTPDGTCVRDYIHVSDLAEAHVQALNHMATTAEPWVFNVGYGHGFSVKQVIETMKSVSGKDIPYASKSRREGDAPTVIADSSRIRHALGWKPKYDDLKFICSTALAWEKKLALRKAK